MTKAKEEFALQVSHRFDSEFSKLQDSLNSSTGEMGTDMEKIKQLQEMHSIAVRFPIWPFNTTSLVRFFSSILFPVLLVIISTIIDLLLQ